MFNTQLPFLPNGSTVPRPKEPDLYRALNALIDPLEELDCVVEKIENELRSNSEARRASQLDEFHCDSEKATLLDEMEVASTATVHLRAIIALANLKL